MDDAFEIHDGTFADYAALARFHYRAGAPARPVRVLRARAEGETVGVLVVASPTLNGAWRGVAWPGLWRGLGKRDAARALNARVRTIARVVVDPRCRGLGVAKALVRAYLDDPCTSHTEAVAAMGAVSPFFAGAGMREVPTPPRQRERALGRALAREGLRAWELMDERACVRALERAPRLRRAVLAYARAGRGTRTDARALRDSTIDGNWVDMAARAASALVAPPRAYVWP